jgi:PAS domain S-box-containing protein
MSRSIPKTKPENLSAAAAVRGPRSRIIGEGEMAELVRGYDWAKTSLGAVETWPDTLVTTVNMLLASRHPMFFWWGPELIQFYNDGYRPSIRGDKHPTALGQRGMECWPEIWEIIGPQIEAVMTRGESTWNINQLVPINRNGKLEEVYWTYSYSPVWVSDGTAQGTLVVCSETTEQVLSERRLRTLLAIGADLAEEPLAAGPQPLRSLAQGLVRGCDGDPADIPFAMLYLLTDNEIIQAGSTGASEMVSDATNWPLREAVDSQIPLLVESLRERFSDMICPPWPEPVTSAYVLPLRMPGAAMQAVLVLGISPRLPFDYRYRTFFELVGTRIIGLLQNATHALELAQAAKRFKDLSQADPFGMLIGGLSGELNYVNPAFLKVLGYTDAEVSSGKVRWDCLTPPEYAEADAKAVEQLRVSGRCDVYEKVYLAKDGRRIPILLGASVIGYASGDVEIAAFITDLTALKAAQQALRAANEELEMKVTERTAELNAEVADRQRAEKSLRELTGRLLRTQDEERRHMARELHDHAGQTLAALAMNLSGLQRAAKGKDPKILNLAAESQQLSEDLSTEIRTLSYLLHPPLLDEAGLTSAVRWYVDGFSQRSKIKVDVEIPAELERLPRELELVIFRVVQESLTNIHRHSGSATAKVHLTQTESAVKFEISDQGKGISEEKQQEMKAAKTGVGVRGMEERVRQFDGTLEIVSDGSGTTVVGVLPVKLMRQE